MASLIDPSSPFHFIPSVPSTDSCAYFGRPWPQANKKKAAGRGLSCGLPGSKIDKYKNSPAPVG
jgi:hypothetical protein